MTSIIWAGGHTAQVPNDVNDYVFFLKKEDVPYGCFSNAYREKGKGHRGLRESSASTAGEQKAEPLFWCVNQELHYRKAELFGDNATSDLILAETEDAGKIKQLGRMVKGYDDAKWTEARYDVARDAVHAKFASDDELKQVLLGTGTKIILEAAVDKAWGIGFVEFSSQDKKGMKHEDTGAWDVEPSLWEGENLLGRCLMDVREQLREGSL